MGDNQHSTNSVNDESKPGSDILWGVAAIGEVINRNPRQTFHLLSRGQIKSAKKKGGLWTATRGALLREFA